MSISRSGINRGPVKSERDTCLQKGLRLIGAHCDFPPRGTSSFVSFVLIKDGKRELKSVA